MSTHDAYFWLAGAEGVGPAANSPLARFAGLLARATDVPAATIGFYAPAFFAGLVGVATLLWAWSLAGIEAGVCAGTLAAIFPGFYFRSRLGYYDTDSVTLLFPLLISWFLMAWTAPRLKPKSWWPLPWLRILAPLPDNAQRTSRPAWTEDAFMLLAGLAARFCFAWRQHIENFTKLNLALAVFLILLCGARARKKQDLWALGFFALGSVLGWPGLAVAATLLAAHYFEEKTHPRTPSLWLRSVWALWILYLSVAFLAGFTGAAWEHGGQLLEIYAKPAAERAVGALAPTPADNPAAALSPTTAPPHRERAVDPADPVVYPAPIQSVQEAQNLDRERLAAHLHPYAWVAVVGTLGFAIVLLARPAALLLAPLAILWAASGLLGLRLGMFGGPPIYLGLCVPLCWAARAVFGNHRWLPACLVGFFALSTSILAGPLALLYPRLELTPVLSQAHAQALLHLRDQSPADAVVWTWWDWGYAARYFSRRAPFADGGRNEGELLFPLGVALTTHSFKQANQLIKFCATHNNAPWEVWSGQPAAKVSEFIASLADKDYNYTPRRKSYLVVSFEQIRVLPWISYYGTWNLATRKGRHALVSRQNTPGIVNYEQGTIFYPQLEQNIRISTIDRIENVVESSGLGDATLQHYDFKRDYGPHLVAWSAVGEAYLLDDLAYNTLLAKLLLRNPNSPELAPYFKLIFEHYPLVRVYEVL